MVLSRSSFALLERNECGKVNNYLVFFAAHPLGFEEAFFIRSEVSLHWPIGWLFCSLSFIFALIIVCPLPKLAFIYIPFIRKGFLRDCLNCSFFMYVDIKHSFFRIPCRVYCKTVETKSDYTQLVIR